MTLHTCFNLSSSSFQLTSSRRGWPCCFNYICYTFNFNSHPHEEDDHTLLGNCCMNEIFQLTSSRRGWLTQQVNSITEDAFQLTSSRRGWHCNLRFCFGSFYFNSHPHEEDDNVSRFLNPSLYISTHILTKRMTKMFVYIISSTSISTHILTKRMTVSYHLGKVPLLFQLTSSRRGWPYFSGFVIVTIPFQLTSSRRGWLYNQYHVPYTTCISTHILTKRMTLNQTAALLCYFYFNSHPHEEDDVYRRSLRTVWDNISTHILTKRMTWAGTSEDAFNEISTHILTKRMTFSLLLFRDFTYISTHILTKRMTISSYANRNVVIFQLTSSRRGWPPRYYYLWGSIRNFNSHPHEEDDSNFKQK